MAKWCGTIGYAVVEETTPGVWEEKIVRRKYKGDLTRNTRRFQTTDQVNDNISISNELSIIADPYANVNFHYMAYAEFRGVKWKISNVEVQHPRLILTLGGEYKGEQTLSASDL